MALKIVTSVMALWWAISVWASDQVKIHSMNEFVQSYQKLSVGYDPEEILVVFDIDNTLLTMIGNLGSDHWFNWQSQLLSSKEPVADKMAKGMVAKDFGGLLDVQGYLFETLPMVEPEEVSVQFLDFLLHHDVPVMALTSRGPSFQTATYRELYKAGYQLQHHSFSEPVDYLKMIPYDKNQLESRYGFTPDQQLRYKLGSPRSVLWKDGVFYSAGQHKGAMLRVLMKDFKIQPKIIFFVDDHEKNVNRVWEAFVPHMHNVEVFTYWYRYLDGRVQKFHKGDKGKVRSLWQKKYKEQFRP